MNSRLGAVKRKSQRIGTERRWHEELPLRQCGVVGRGARLPSRPVGLGWGRHQTSGVRTDLSLSNEVVLQCPLANLGWWVESGLESVLVRVGYLLERSDHSIKDSHRTCFLSLKCDIIAALCCFNLLVPSAALTAKNITFLAVSRLETASRRPSPLHQLL